MKWGIISSAPPFFFSTMLPQICLVVTLRCPNSLLTVYRQVSRQHTHYCIYTEKAIFRFLSLFTMQNYLFSSKLTNYLCFFVIKVYQQPSGCSRDAFGMLSEDFVNNCSHDMNCIQKICENV